MICHVGHNGIEHDDDVYMFVATGIEVTSNDAMR